MISSNTDNEFLSDSLILSGFLFIASYYGKDITIGEVYETAIRNWRILNEKGIMPQAHVYQADLDIWKKRIHLKNKTADEIKVQVSNSVANDLFESTRLYLKADFDIVPSLNSQETFTYATYFFFEQFLKNLDERDDVYIQFPSIDYVLENYDLEHYMKRCLSNHRNIVFMPYEIGIRK